MRANRVWSLPVPTLRPACHLVPRWRARILPASTISPPVDFKPSRRPAESRPFREDPPAFLCAIVVSLNSLTLYTDSVTESSHFFLLFVADLLARLAGFFSAALAGFLLFPALLALADLVSAAASAWAFSPSAGGFGARLGRGAAVFDGFAPPVRISVMRITENS